MKYRLPLVGILACAFLATAQQTPPPAAPPAFNSLPAAGADPVILTVGDEKITKSQFEQIIATLPEQQRAQLQTPGGKRKLAESLAELKALAQEGRARKIEQTLRVKLQIDQIIAQNMFQELAKDSAAPESTLPPDAATLHAYYDAHKQDWDEVKAKHILIRFQGSTVPVRPGEKDLSDADALAKAKAIRAKIIAGAKFDDQAKAESDDVSNAPQGGDLGSFTRGRMVPAFEETAFGAEIGKVSEPVKTQFGYHLILVESHSAKTFDQARPEIEQKMKGQQMQEAQQKAQQQGQKALADLKMKKSIVFDEAYFGK